MRRALVVWSYGEEMDLVQVQAASRTQGLRAGGRADTAASLWLPRAEQGAGKRCVQEGLWQGGGVVAVLTYATVPDNAATGPPGRAGVPRQRLVAPEAMAVSVAALLRHALSW